MADNYTRRISLFINGKDIRANIASVKEEMNKLVEEQSKMTKGSKEYVKAGKEIKVLKAIIKENTFDIATTKGEMIKLINQQARMTIGSKEYLEAGKDIKKLKGILAEHNNSLKTTSNWWGKIKETAGGFLAASAIMAAASRLKDFLMSTLSDYDKAAQSEKKLQVALGDRTGIQNNLIKQAKDLQKSTTFEDDAIIAQQAFLAAQGRTETQIRKTIEAAIQLSSVTGDDLESSVKKLDMTYEGSIGRLGKLDSRFKDLTKEQLANGEAVDLVIKKYSGFAEAAAETGLGPMKQLENVWGDLKETLGGFVASAILPAVKGLKSFVTGINEAMVTKDLTTVFDEQASKVVDLQQKVLPLADRYDILKSKTNLNKKEHEELKNIIKQVSEQMPNAITKFDQYGNAVEISTKRVRESVDVEIARLKVMNADAIQDVLVKLSDLRTKIESNQRTLKEIEKTGSFEIVKSWTDAEGKLVEIRSQASAKEVADFTNKHKQLINNQIGYQAQYRLLTGDAIKNEIKKREDAAAKEKEIENKKNSYKNLTIEKLKELADDEDEVAISVLKEREKKEKKHQSYSIEQEKKYMDDKKALIKAFETGLIANKERLEAELLSKEIFYMNEAIEKGKVKGKEKLDMESQLADKQKQLAEYTKKRLEYLNNSDETDTGKENQRYKKDLEDFYGYVEDKTKLSKTEKQKLESIEKEHALKIGEIDAKIISKEIETKKQGFDNSLELLKEKNLKELDSITTLEQAKEILKNSLNDKELNNLKTLEDAKNAIRKQQLQDEIKIQTQNLDELLNIVKKLQKGENFEGISLADEILSPEEVETLNKYFFELQKSKNELTKKGDNTEGNKKDVSPLTNKADILGFTSDDWTRFFDNIKNGTDVYGEWVSEVAMGLEALSNMYQTYFSFIEAGEKRQLQAFESSQNKKKKKLKEQLDSGMISQESYTKQIDDLDAQSDQKKAQFDYDSAVRQRNVAFMGAVVNTALGVTKALAELGPFGIPMAIAVGAMGALQAGAILATPLPELPGKETGGFIDVSRSQDNKKFRAKNQANKRGYVSSPTIITGENGLEYIVPDEATNNPSIRPVLDILEMARQNKNLATLNFPKVYEATVSNRISGRESGGRFDSAQRPGSFDSARFDSARFDSAQRPDSSLSDRSVQAEQLMSILMKLDSTVTDLKKKLDDPIQTYVTVHGKNGLAEKMKEYDNLKNNASL